MKEAEMVQVHTASPPVVLSTRQEEVWRKLQGGRWFLGSSISNGLVGGSEGLRRLRELRALGFKVEKKWAPKITARWKDRKQFAYRITGYKAPKGGGR